MLDLQAGVHLEEVEAPVLVEELDRAGALVAARPADLDRRRAHRLAQVVGKLGRRALLDELLVPALARAVPLTEPDGVAVAVGEDLHLDVAGPGEVALEVDLGAPEGRLRLALGGLHRLGRVSRRRSRPSCPRPPPPKAALMATGQPCSSPKAMISAGSGSGSLRPGTPATPARSAASRALILSPIISIASGGGPMNVAPAAATARAKAAFSAKKP